MKATTSFGFTDTIMNYDMIQLTLFKWCITVQNKGAFLAGVKECRLLTYLTSLAAVAWRTRTALWLCAFAIVQTVVVTDS